MKAIDLIPTVDQHTIQDSTKIVCFMNCPRRYFYEYVLGWRPETPSNHLVFGSAWHKAMEVLAAEGYSSSSILKAHKEFLHEYRRTFPPETDELFHPKTPDNALIVLAEYAKHYAHVDKEIEVLHIEVGGKVYINPAQAIHFKMDTICNGKRGIFSREHKTASSFYLWDYQWPLSMQVGTYTYVLHCLYPNEKVTGVEMNGICFKKVKKAWDDLLNGRVSKNAMPYDFYRFEAFRTQAQITTWLWTAQYYLDTIEANFKWLSDCTEDDAFLSAFQMNSTHCTAYNGCPWIDFCNTWQNPLRRCESPPIGFKVEHWDPSKQETRTQLEIDESRKVVSEKGN